MMKLRSNLTGGFLVFLTCVGCAPMGIALLYQKTKLPQEQVVRNICYSNAPDADPIKNTLNLFLPAGENWPTVIFVHGGEWHEGDKDLKVAGADIYNNIGRYFASQGIGAVVISYRLLPAVDWRTQIMDVARAIDWVYGHIQQYHGNAHAIFLMGHSAGAQLAARVILDPGPLTSLGVSPNIVSGVIPISGVGYNFLNEETYEYGRKKGVVKKDFHAEDLSLNMRKKLSPIFFVHPGVPPFLILYAQNDPKPIRHASMTLSQALTNAGASNQLYAIPKQNHESMVLALSQSKIPTDMVIVFLRTLRETPMRKTARP
jgi:arylformamidase